MPRPTAPAPPRVTTRPPEPAGPPPADLQRRNRFLTVAVVILGIVSIILAVMAFLPSSAPIKVGAARTATQASAEEQIEEIAQAFSESIATYDYRRVNETLQKAQQYTTEAFAQHYQVALRGDVQVFRRRIESSKAIATSETRGVAVQSIDAETASVIAFTTQTLRTEEEPRPQTRFVVMDIALVKTGGEWKVDSLRLPPGVTRATAG